MKELLLFGYIYFFCKYFKFFSEQATDGSLSSENWALNMEICDIINETEEGPRDAIKAIKRRLNQSAGKNYTIVMYTLTVSIHIYIPISNRPLI